MATIRTLGTENDGLDLTIRAATSSELEEMGESALGGFRPGVGGGIGTIVLAFGRAEGDSELAATLMHEGYHAGQELRDIRPGIGFWDRYNHELNPYRLWFYTAQALGVADLNIATPEQEIEERARTAAYFGARSWCARHHCTYPRRRAPS